MGQMSIRLRRLLFGVSVIRGSTVMLLYNNISQYYNSIIFMGLCYCYILLHMKAVLLEESTITVSDRHESEKTPHNAWNFKLFNLCLTMKHNAAHHTCS